MADSLYDTDFVAWSEQQAALLRRHLAGERVNGLDWENIVEEIESLGRSETKQVESLLIQAMAHRLKIERWPTHPAVGHWWGEAGIFLLQARENYLRSMARRLDVAACFARARARVEVLPPQHVPAQPIPTTTEATLEALLDEAVPPQAALDALVGHPRRT